MILDHAPATRDCAEVLRYETLHSLMPEFTKIETWTERLGHSRLRTFTDEHNHFWLEQNASKSSKWAKLARQGHDIAWEFDSPGGAYTGRLLIDGEVYTSAEATTKFLGG